MEKSVSIFLAILIINFTTLLFPALKGPKGWKILYQNPAFLFGDFFLIPIYAVLISQFLSIHPNQLTLSLSENMLVYFLGATTILIIIFRVFRPNKKIGTKIFIPHIIFSIALIISLLAGISICWTTKTVEPLFSFALLILAAHCTLSWIFPKRFDNVQGLFPSD